MTPHSRATVPHPLVMMWGMTNHITTSRGTPTRHMPEGTLIIDCDTCVMRRSDVCGDCVVTFLLERDERGAVVLDFAEVRAMKLLADAGLVPTLRHRGCR
jgi:hypothetical protein